MNHYLNITNQRNGKLIIAIARTMQLTHRKSIAMFHEYGLTSAQFAVLEALFHKGALTVNDIILSVLSTSGNMTVVLKNLEKQELVSRKENLSDKRSFLIEITAKGRELMEEVFPKHMSLLCDSLSMLTEKEKQTVIDILRKVKDN